MATLTMERVFAAPATKVFAFLTRTENLLDWWGPEGTSIREHDLDFSRLGKWSAVMVGPQGGAQEIGGEVLAIDPPNMVELSLSFVMEGGRGPEHIDDMMNKGWNSALWRLEQLIQKN